MIVFCSGDDNVYEKKGALRFPVPGPQYLQFRRQTLQEEVNQASQKCFNNTNHMIRCNNMVTTHVRTLLHDDGRGGCISTLVFHLGILGSHRIFTPFLYLPIFSYGGPYTPYPSAKLYSP